MKQSNHPLFLKSLLSTFHLWHESLHRFFLAAMLIVFVLVFGTVGYVLIEKMSVFDSLYMTVITIATVGFHEVGELTNQGRMFTIMMIFLGIGVGGYAIGTIAAFIVEGQIMDILKGRRMVKEITGLRNHIIVCGFGKIGTEVCNVLSLSNQPFIVIDSDPEKIDEALGLGYIAAVGEATDDDILERAGIKHAHGLISAISDDSANVYLVLTARALNDKLRIIARGVGEKSKKKMVRAGADKVVSPFEIGARRMAALMMKPDIVDFLEALSPATTYGLRLERVTIQKSSSLCNKRLDQSYIKKETDGALILGIEKPEKPIIINPPGSTVLEQLDILLAIGNDKQLSLLQQMAN